LLKIKTDARRRIITISIVVRAFFIGYRGLYKKYTRMKVG
jgi:hypothetical protein